MAEARNDEIVQSRGVGMSKGRGGKAGGVRMGEVGLVTLVSGPGSKVTMSKWRHWEAKVNVHGCAMMN